MKAAERIYTKGKKTFNQSPEFRSTVQRTIQRSTTTNPGPGQYQIILPIVKPKIQAIVKKNQSILIKVNETDSPAFSSREPRFKQYSSLEYDESEKAEEVRIRFQEEAKEEWKPKRYNFALAKKLSTIRLSSQVEKSYKRDLKGSLWSKDRESRNLWNKSQLIPGPGFYHFQRKKRRKMPTKQDKTSWQFKSLTKRSSILLPQDDVPKSLDPSLITLNPIHTRTNQ